MSESDPASFLSGIVHEETQREGPGVDLTVAAVATLEDPGRVDFGGGELAPAATRSVPTERRSPNDEYGWWHLEPGTYLLEHNETLRSDAPAFVLQARPELLARGASHPTVRVASLDPIPLTVGDAGIRLKENARVSRLFPR